ASDLATTLGRSDESIALNRQVLERDPLSKDIYSLLGMEHIAAGRLEVAEASFRKIVELDPHFVYAHYGIAWTHLLRKDAKKALAEAQLESDCPFRLTALSIA